MNTPSAFDWRHCLGLAALLLASPLSMIPRLQAADQPMHAATVAADPVVMTVNGEPVSADEYTLIMHGRVAEVFSYFFEKSGMEDRLGYWKDDGQPENPIRKLQGMVTEELRRLKTVQHLAKKKGLVQDISYAAFKDRLAKENARRREALASNQVIYGPQQHREPRYYYFQQKDLEQALLESLSKGPELAVSSEEIEKFHAEHKEALGETLAEDKRFQIISELQKRKFQALIDDLVAKADVRIQSEILKGIAPRHDT